MNRTLKNLVVPIIIVLLFTAAYFFIIMPYGNRRLAKENVFKNFEKSLSNLDVNYKKDGLDAKEYGAWKANIYITDTSIIKLFVFNKDAKQYQEGLQDGVLKSSISEDNDVYGVFYGYCVYSVQLNGDIDEKEQQLLNDFINIAKEYESSI